MFSFLFIIIWGCFLFPIRRACSLPPKVHGLSFFLFIKGLCCVVYVSFFFFFLDLFVVALFSSSYGGRIIKSCDILSRGEGGSLSYLSPS